MTAANRQPLQLRLLGPVEVQLAPDQLAAPPGPRAKALIIALSLNPGRICSAEQLIDDVWGLDAPASAKTALHTLISRTRSFCPELLESSSGGYRLGLVPTAVDLWEAERLRRDAVAALAQDPLTANALAETALGLWAGEPGGDASPSPAVEQLQRQAEKLVGELQQLSGQALLASGNATAAIPALQHRAEHEPLNEAANLLFVRALREAGRTPEALEQFESFRRRLRSELGSSPSPAAAAWQARLLASGTDQETVGPSAPSRRQYRSGLRAAPNELLGRDTDLAAVESLMESARVTTVLGPGGLGKTRLAMEIAQRAADAGMPGVLVVELASVRDGADIWLALASALGIAEPGQKAARLAIDVRQRIIDNLAERRSLLFLDNCEHVIEEVAGIVADLIASVAPLKVLTTSRSPLDIAGERIYPLQALAVVAEAGTPAAVALFLERAAAARPTAALPADTVAKLCAHLEGLPLAIELAAARVRTMNVDEIRTRINEKFALLTVLRGSDRTAPERHRTLHAVIEWSWSLLRDSEQATLRRLCAFPDGFSLEAAIAVAGWDRADPGSVENDIEALLNQSLLRIQEHPLNGQLRYRMLETVREFGGLKQDAAAEQAEVALRMAQWARLWCRARVTHCYGPQQVVTVQEVTVEQDTLVFLLRRALAEKDSATVFWIFGLLGNYWSIRSMHQDVVSFAGAVWAAVAGQHVEDQDVPAALLSFTVLSGNVGLVDLRLSARARTMIRRMLARDVETDQHLRAMSGILLNMGSADRLQASITAARASSSILTQASSYMIETFLYENSGQTVKAIAAAQQAFRLAKKFDDRWTMGTVSVSLSQLFSQQANHAQSLIWAGRAVGHLQALDAVGDLRQLHAMIAASQVSIGQLSAARQTLDTALADANQDQDEAVLVGSNIALKAEIALHSGQIPEGLEIYRTLLDSRVYRHMPMGPYSPLLFSAAIGAHLIFGLSRGAPSHNGEVPDLERWVRQLRHRTLAWRRIGGDAFIDRPVLGASLLIIGSWAVLTSEPESTRSGIGLELMALSDGRQDLPSLLRESHLRAARKHLGTERVTGALAAAPGFETAEALARAYRLLADPALR